MPTDVIHHLRRAALLCDHAGLTDGQLLGRFVEQRDQDAFASLVRRHGPMVWGVCRRVLANGPDAEDAFQAAFLVLVRKAASVVPREMVGNWLYGVAHQAALKARRGIIRRREKPVAALPERAVTDPDSASDLRPLLDHELSRLPDKYRVVIVLCDLEGKTRTEAARQLGWPEGTVAGRLARAREMLAGRLARRGVSLSGMAMLAPSGVPGIVVSSTIQAATAGTVSAPVAILLQGVLNAMFLTKLKTAAMVLAMLGAATLTCGMIAGKGDGPETSSARGEPEKSVKKAAPDPKADALRRERKKFEGTWRLVSTEVDGKKRLPSEIFKDKGIIVFDSAGRFEQQTGGGPTKAATEIDLEAKPRSIRLTVTSKGESEGRTVRYIYEFINVNSFRWRPYQFEKVRPTDFETKVGTQSMRVFVFERVEKPNPLEGTVKEVDDGKIVLTSGEGVALDPKTEYLQKTGLDAAPIKRKDVVKGKVVSIWTKKQDEKLVAVLVVVALVQPDSKTIDAAILERLRNQGLKSSAASDDIAFIRRLYLDVLGVPPSPQEVEDFVKDKAEDKRAKLGFRLTARKFDRGLAPGRYTGARQQMVIAADGAVSYADAPGPRISHIEITADGRLKAIFYKENKPIEATLKVSDGKTAKKKRVVWAAVVKGDTLEATAIPFSTELYQFRLEIFTGGKLVAGAQEFYAIRATKPILWDKLDSPK